MSNTPSKAGFSHEKIETNNFLMIVLILLVLLASLFGHQLQGLQVREIQRCALEKQSG